MICASAAPTLLDYYKDNYRPMRLVGCSPKTLIQYDVSLGHWQRFAGQLPLERIDSRTMASFAESLLPGRKPSTVNKIIRHVMPILRFASEEDDIAKPPKFRKLRESKRVPLALTVAEFLAVLTEAEKQPGTVGGIPAPAWWRSLLCVDWETGLRITALLSVRCADVLVAQSGLYCRAEEQKDLEAQWYPLSTPTMANVAAIFSLDRPLLWPREVKPATITRRFRKILDNSGIYAPKGSGMVFHRIRKSTASYLKAAGMDAQKKLGHSAPSVTERYMDPRIVGKDKPADLVAAPIK
jgi:integrase